jgi:hypothetical protein
MRKTNLEKLGFGLGPDLMIANDFNLNMTQKKVLKIKWLISHEHSEQAQAPHKN